MNFQSQYRIMDTRIVTLDDAFNRHDMTLIEPISVVHRSHPGFVLNISGEELVHHLYHTHPIELGGVFKSEWDNATLFGWNAIHTFINADADFTCQDIVGTASRVDRHLQNLPGLPYRIPGMKRSNGKVTLDFTEVPSDIICKLDDDVYFGSPIEPLNWGMWLLHCIPSAADYVASGQKGLFGCWSKLGWQQQLLSFMGIAAEKMFQVDEWRTHVVKRLTFRSYPNIDLYIGQKDKEIFSAIARQCLQRSDVCRSPRIFVSRQTKSMPGAARRLANEAELSAALQAIGFVVVEPEQLSFDDQVALFASATAIVGLGGAGLFNAVFSKPGTKLVTLEASNAFIHSHANLFSSLGLDYAVVFGKRNELDDRWPHHEWTIDVPRTIAQIQRFI